MSMDRLTPEFTTIMAKAMAAAPLSPAREIIVSWFFFILKGAISPKTESGLAIISIKIASIKPIGSASIIKWMSDRSPKRKNMAI